MDSSSCRFSVDWVVLSLTLFHATTLSSSDRLRPRRAYNASYNDVLQRLNASPAYNAAHICSRCAGSPAPARAPPPLSPSAQGGPRSAPAHLPPSPAISRHLHFTSLHSTSQRPQTGHLPSPPPPAISAIPRRIACTSTALSRRPPGRRPPRAVQRSGLVGMFVPASLLASLWNSAPNAYAERYDLHAGHGGVVTWEVAVLRYGLRRVEA